MQAWSVPPLARRPAGPGAIRTSRRTYVPTLTTLNDDIRASPPSKHTRRGESLADDTLAPQIRIPDGGTKCTAARVAGGTGTRVGGVQGTGGVDDEEVDGLKGTDERTPGGHARWWGGEEGGGEGEDLGTGRTG